MQLENMPYGALASREYMEELLCRAHQGEPIKFYHVYALGEQSFVETLHLLPTTVLEEVVHNFIFTGISLKLSRVSVEYSGGRFEDEKYISYNGEFGRQLGNNHFYFMDRDDAEDYKQFAMTDKEMLADYKRHKELCKRFDDIWDAYDDFDSYDD